MTRLGGRGLALVIALLCFAFGLAAPAFAAVPTITSFTPTSGPAHTTVTITGTNFTSPATVKFNGAASGSVVVKSATTITAVAPPTVSSGPISVTTSGGTAVSSASFTVTPGMSVSVSTGPPGSSTVVYFSGFAAYEAVDFYFDTTDVQLVSATATGTGHTTVTVPSSATPGTHYLSVVGRHSGYSAQAAFTVRTDWPQYGFDAGHTGDNPYEATLGEGNVKKLARVWRNSVTTGGNLNYQVVVAGGIIYSGNDNGVVATSEATGAQVWTAAVGEVDGTPAVSGSTVVVGTTTGHLVGLNAATGAVKYNNTAASESFSQSITVSNGIGYTEEDETSSPYWGQIVAFNMTTGTPVWSYQLETTCSAEAVSNGVVYADCTDQHLYGVNASNGSLVFNTDGSEFEAGPSVPVVANGLLFVTGFNESADTDEVVAYDADTGALAWAKPSPLESTGNILTVADDEVFEQAEDENSGDPEVCAFATADGTLMWTVAGPTSYEYPMTVANGLLYVPGNPSTWVLDVTTGARVTQVRGSQFAIVTDAGVITALDGTSLLRYALPASAYPAVQRPTAATLRPNYALRARA